MVAAPAEVAAMDSSTGLCRLCLRHDKTIMNIFEEVPMPAEEKAPETEASTKNINMVERLLDLLGVKV